MNIKRRFRIAALPLDNLKEDNLSNMMNIDESPMVPEFNDSQPDLQFQSLKEDIRKFSLYSIIEGPAQDG